LRAPTLGNSVTFSWQLEHVGLPPTNTYPAKVFLEAGSGPGMTDLAILDVTSGSLGTIWGPPGTYWTRVRTENACGTSVVSDDVEVTLTDECVVPGRPTGLDIIGAQAGDADPTSAFPRWQVPTGATVTQYAVDIASAVGPTYIGSYSFASMSLPSIRGL